MLALCSVHVDIRQYMKLSLMILASTLIRFMEETVNGKKR